ncbi:MAG TPA: SIMPL domain-containing protein [Bacilli bacterium]
MKINKKFFLLAGIVSLAVIALPLLSNVLGDAVKSDKLYAENEVTTTTTTNKNVITVNGKGEMMVDPDVAYVSIGVQTQAGTANEAQAANAQAFAKLEKVLYETYKIAKKDVKTTGFQVQPEYQYGENVKPKITGYTSDHTIQVTYRDLLKLGGLLDAVSKAGVNRVNNIQFSTEKGDEYTLQILDKAMANAEAKAKRLAKYAGKEIKGIVNITENGGSGVPIQYADYGMMKSEAAMDAAAPTSISAGQLTISTNVTVQFEF